MQVVTPSTQVMPGPAEYSGVGNNQSNSIKGFGGAYRTAGNNITTSKFSPYQKIKQVKNQKHSKLGKDPQQLFKHGGLKWLL
jgi:hypothetical protein